MWKNSTNNAQSSKHCRQATAIPVAPLCPTLLKLSKVKSQAVNCSFFFCVRVCMCAHVWWCFTVWLSVMKRHYLKQQWHCLIILVKYRLLSPLQTEPALIHIYAKQRQICHRLIFASMIDDVYFQWWNETPRLTIIVIKRTDQLL